MTSFGAFQGDFFHFVNSMHSGHVLNGVQIDPGHANDDRLCFSSVFFNDGYFLYGSIFSIFFSIVALVRRNRINVNNNFHQVLKTHLILIVLIQKTSNGKLLNELPRKILKESCASQRFL